MKLTTKLVNKIGADRLLHCSIAANIVQAGSDYGDLGVFIAACIAIILIILKEYIFDDKEEGNEADPIDIYWGFGGVAIGVVLYIISVFAI